MKARPILIIEDEHALGSAISLLVRRMGHLPSLVASGQAGLKAFGEAEFDAVVLDIGLPDMSGLQVLENLRASGALVPVLVITAHATLRHAIDSQKSGATAYLTKPLDMKQFQQTLDALLAPQIKIGEAVGKGDADEGSPALIGGAPCLRETFLGIARGCAVEFPVLITGPGGSGKSLVASVIHAHSKRSGDALRVIACGGIQNEAEFREMTVGSVVLDEISLLDLGLQSSLVAWLAEAGTIKARVMATSTQDPLDAVHKGLLREDLYYALSPLTIPVPSLAERSGDIPALCAFFAGIKHEGLSPRITPPVMAALQAYEWPGNVRELRHVVEYVLSMSQGGTVFLSHLPAHVAATAVDSENDALTSGELESVLKRWIDAALSQPDDMLPSYDDLLQQIEAKLLKYLLEKHEMRPTRLATAMQIHRGTLRQKLQRAGLHRLGD